MTPDTPPSDAPSGEWPTPADLAHLRPLYARRAESDGPLSDAATTLQLIDALAKRCAAPPPDAGRRGEDKLMAAINWLMGCGDDFTPRSTPLGTVAPYWWRSEFAQRAGLEYDQAKHEYVGVPAHGAGETRSGLSGVNAQNTSPREEPNNA